MFDAVITALKEIGVAVFSHGGNVFSLGYVNTSESLCIWVLFLFCAVFFDVILKSFCRGRRK